MATEEEYTHKVDDFTSLQEESDRAKKWSKHHIDNSEDININQAPNSVEDRKIVNTFNPNNKNEENNINNNKANIEEEPTISSSEITTIDNATVNLDAANMKDRTIGPITKEGIDVSIHNPNMVTDNTVDKTNDH